jgi:hypothetical protein
MLLPLPDQRVPIPSRELLRSVRNFAILFKSGCSEVSLKFLKLAVSPQAADPGGNHVSDDLAAGNYTMEVLASKKKQVAQQWIDVTIVDPRK